MDADEILHNYSPELQLIDMLDWLQCTTGYEASPIPPVLDSSTSKIAAEFLRTDPTPGVSAQDILLP